MILKSIFRARPRADRARGIRSVLAVAVVAAGVLTTGKPGALAQTGSPHEYALKAAVLYHFAEFVEWPAQAERDTITVCVAGKTAYDAARETIGGKSIRGKTLVVRQFTGPQDLRNCHILFISAAEKGRMRPILDTVRNTSVLTVGETGGFTESGGIINFKAEGNHLRFDINPDAATRVGLRISSQLLKLARVVRA